MIPPNRHGWRRTLRASWKSFPNECFREKMRRAFVWWRKWDFFATIRFWSGAFTFITMHLVLVTLWANQYLPWFGRLCLAQSKNAQSFLLRVSPLRTKGVERGGGEARDKPFYRLLRNFERLGAIALIPPASAHAFIVWMQIHTSCDQKKRSRPWFAYFIISVASLERTARVLPIANKCVRTVCVCVHDYDTYM